MPTMEDPDFASAVAVIQEAIAEYEQLPPETQRILDAGIVQIRAKLEDILARAATRSAELERARESQRQASAASRKQVRDQAIPDWCMENLKPGMVVKVKAASRTTLRQVIEVFPASQWSPGSFRGHHCHYSRVKCTEEIVTQLVLDGYITDHVLTNVQGVVLSTDARGRAVVTKIMDLVDGVKNLDA